MAMKKLKVPQIMDPLRQDNGGLLILLLLKDDAKPLNCSSRSNEHSECSQSKT